MDIITYALLKGKMEDSISNAVETLETEIDEKMAVLDAGLISVASKKGEVENNNMTDNAWDVMSSGNSDVFATVDGVLIRTIVDNTNNTITVSDHNDNVICSITKNGTDDYSITYGDAPDVDLNVCEKGVVPEWLWSSGNGTRSVMTVDANSANGNHAIAIGEGIKADANNQVVVGKYNIATNNELFVVGNGESNSNRSNAFSVDSSGKGRFSGNVYAGTVQSPAVPVDDNDLTTKQYVDGRLDNYYTGFSKDANDILSFTSADIGVISDDSNYINVMRDYIGFMDKDILGVQFDFENDTATRLASAKGLNPGTDFDKFSMYGGRRRCNVADDGTINAYYGDDEYVEDGSNGQVMVYQPKFYYRMVPLKTQKQEDGIGYHLLKANYYISETPKEGFDVFPAFINEDDDEVDYILIGAYEGSIYDTSESAYLTLDEQVMNLNEDKFCSIANVKPASGQTQQLARPNIETLCVNRGSGWHSENVQIAHLNIWLLAIEYATFNSRLAIGDGITNVTDNSAYNCAANTGSTSALGNGTGQAESSTFVIGEDTVVYTDANKKAVSYRGVENDWGNIWEFVYGVNIWGNGKMNGGMPYICSDYQYAESKRTDNYIGSGFTLTNTSGYVKYFGYSEKFKWLLYPSLVGGNARNHIGDYCYVINNLNAFRVASRGGRWSSGSFAGSLCWTLIVGVGARDRNVGGRLAYVPRI